MGGKVYFTMLRKDEAKAKEIFFQLRNYGLNPQGHFWKDDLKNMAWAASRNDLQDTRTKAWLIYGQKEDWFSPSIRQGLSLLFLCKRPDLNVIVLTSDKDGLTGEDLPFVWSGVHLVGLSEGFVPKVVAKVHLPAKKRNLPYRVVPHPVPGLGLWMEVAPSEGEWQGILIGARKAEIKHLGIGEEGRLPEKSTLEYPVRDMKIEVEGQEFVAWAVQNRLNQGVSAFVNLTDAPEEMVFGPWNNEKPEIYNLPLC